MNTRRLISLFREVPEEIGLSAPPGGGNADPATPLPEPPYFLELLTYLRRRKERSEEGINADEDAVDEHDMMLSG